MTRIAMWSGPRNLSTAMMYAFAARGDCAVADEPFYAAYLALTGLDHPMRDEILAAQSQNPDDVVSDLMGQIPGKLPVFYQKHMCHHMIPDIPRDWMAECINVFLIRHPARVIASYAAKRENPVLDDIGFRQQVDLFHHAKRLQGKTVVIDSHDIRADPHGMMQRLCTEIGLDFTENMLSWPSGGHKDDGVWARHWYGAVWNSTGFADAEGPLPHITGPLAQVLEQAMPFYEDMRPYKI